MTSIMTRIIFMGTPRFAVPSLRAVASQFDAVGVVTQPDRPAGRGRKIRPSAVKLAALDLGLPLFQPESLREAEALQRLKDWGPDVIAVAAFGQILPRAVLDLPLYGCVNVHASLLPRWRGAAPVAWAILEGDDVTGVTIMKMDMGLDTGPVLATKKEPILPRDTRERLEVRLADVGAELLVETLPKYLRCDLLPHEQPPEGATKARRLRSEDGMLDWALPVLRLDRQVRALNPWPGAYSEWNGRRLYIRQAEPVPGLAVDAAPGTVVALPDGIVVATGKGALRVLEMQLAGRRKMNVSDFVRGRPDWIGARLEWSGVGAR
jgi:methionyl-tRNA formyltransferase